MRNRERGRIRVKRTCALAALLLLPGASFAGTATTTFSVQMTVAASCAIVSAPTLTFSSPTNAFTANVDATSQIQVQCTNTTPYNVGLDAGAGSGATVTTRKMTVTGGGTTTISYSLYSDINHTTVWGTTVGTNTVSQTGNGQSQSFTVYGRVPPQTAQAPGTYTDTINITVTY
jgi:spore coat protein U-like protein